MAPVRIPGPESIAPVAVARDPGTRRATGADFGAQVGDAVASGGAAVGGAVEDFGKALGAIGEKLHRERQAAEDQVAVDTWELEHKPRLQRELLAARQEMPAGGEGFTAKLGERLSRAEQESMTTLRGQGWAPSEKAQRAIQSRAMNLRETAMVSGVTIEHNERIRALADQTGKNLDAVASEALGTGDVDGALKRADEVLAGKEGLFGPEAFAQVRDEKRRKIVDSAIAGLKSAGRLDEADAVAKKFYGSVPEKGGAGGFEGALTKRESGGNPTKVNPFGFVGLYQFGAPRLADLGVYTPGAGENLKSWSTTPQAAPGKWGGAFNIPGHPEVKTLADFRASPEAQRTAYRLHVSRMDQEIAANGLDKFIGQDVGGVTITRDGLQAMLHLGGVGGAKRALASNGADAPRDANGTSVMDYARMGAQSAGKPEMANPERALYWRGQIETAKVQDRSQRDIATSEQFERQVLDASAGKAPLPARADIESNPDLSEPRRNALLRQYDSAADDVVKLQAAIAKFQDPEGGAFNPFDQGEKKVVDKVYAALGGNMTALQAVVDRTGMVPTTAARDLRASLVSNDAGRVASALQLSANLLAKNPNVLAGVDGRTDIEDAAVAFRHNVEHYGMSAEQAAAKFVKEQSPEYQADLKRRIKAEDVDMILAKEAQAGNLAADLKSAFNEGLPLFGRPAAEFTPEARQVAQADYAELVKERYLETGDLKLAKTLAQSQMKKVWGVTYVTGSTGGVLMRFPPERAPAYAAIPDASDRIAEQAIADIKAAAGQDVPRNKLIIGPTPGGQTARAYPTGEPVPYSLSWLDKDGRLHMLSPGKAFQPDPKRMREQVSGAREKALGRAAEISDLNAELAGDTRRPWYVP
jgi:hypothetical protein